MIKVDITGPRLLEHTLTILNEIFRTKYLIEHSKKYKRNTDLSAVLNFTDFNYGHIGDVLRCHTCQRGGEKDSGGDDDDNNNNSIKFFILTC
jgi:hypothetical protein